VSEGMNISEMRILIPVEGSTFGLIFRGLYRRFRGRYEEKTLQSVCHIGRSPD